MERVFVVCHGCRRCVNLCASFPTLFDLVVVDQCYLCDLCDLCYTTKCPYTPPHPWNLDFAHLMLRAKAIKHHKGEVQAKEKFLASTDSHGSFAGIPSVVGVVNAINKTKPMRALMSTSPALAKI